MAENLICIHLYGDGSRNSRLRAEYIYCDQAGVCSACQNGKCFCVTTLFGTKCPIGHVSKVDGGTKQSKKFYALKGKVKADEHYAKLDYPHYDYVARIGDSAFLNVPYIILKDVAVMMALLKIARIATGSSMDSYVDLAGYAACGGEIAARMDGKEQKEETTS